MDGKWSPPSPERCLLSPPRPAPPPPDLECVFQIKMGLGVRWYAFSLGDGTDVIRSDLLPFARITVLEGLWFPTQPGLLIFMLALAFFTVESERWGRHILFVYRCLYFTTATSGICLLQPVIPSRVCVWSSEGLGGGTDCLQEFKLDIWFVGQRWVHWAFPFYFNSRLIFISLIKLACEKVMAMHYRKRILTLIAMLLWTVLQLGLYSSLFCDLHISFVACWAVISMKEISLYVVWDHWH